MFLGGGGGGKTWVPHSMFPAHLQNSCDNMDRVAMEIWLVLRVGSDEVLSLGHSSQTDSSLFTFLLHRHNNPQENLHELRATHTGLCDTSSLLTVEEGGLDTTNFPAFLQTSTSQDFTAGSPFTKQSPTPAHKAEPTWSSLIDLRRTSTPSKLPNPPVWELDKKG